MASTQIKVPSGWFVTIFGDEDGELVARNGKTGRKRQMSNLQVPFPGPEIIDKVLKDHKIRVKDSNGHTHLFEGSKAAGAQAWQLYMEYLRGLLRPGRKHPVGDEDVRKIAAGLTVFGRRETIRTKAMSSEEFDTMAAEALKAADGDAVKALAAMKAQMVA
ncbi:hypothetical protein LCGC14_2880340 [marine sediment metagenome]|uniref:Uncharacterized protein n=1 Tax=marine sediment metagenome TaxID=412755 RepID=A0A0F9A880_9ZZZZ